MCSNLARNNNNRTNTLSLKNEKFATKLVTFETVAYKTALFVYQYKSITSGLQVTVQMCKVNTVCHESLHSPAQQGFRSKFQ